MSEEVGGPRLDLLVWRRMLRDGRGDAIAQRAWVSLSINKPVQMPEGWPPATWLTGLAPRDCSREAARQWFEHIRQVLQIEPSLRGDWEVKPDHTSTVVDAVYLFRRLNPSTMLPPPVPLSGIPIGIMPAAAALAMLDALGSSLFGSTHDPLTPPTAPEAATPDGPRGKWGIWYDGKRYPAPGGAVYRLIEYMWSRESARFEEMIGRGKPVWTGQVSDQTVRGRVSEANETMRPIPLPWRLTVDSAFRTISKMPRETDSIRSEEGSSPDS